MWYEKWKSLNGQIKQNRQKKENEDVTNDEASTTNVLETSVNDEDIVHLQKTKAELRALLAEKENIEVTEVSTLKTKMEQSAAERIAKLEVKVAKCQKMTINFGKFLAEKEQNIFQLEQKLDLQKKIYITR